MKEKKSREALEFMNNYSPLFNLLKEWIEEGGEQHTQYNS